MKKIYSSFLLIISLFVIISFSSCSDDGGETPVKHKKVPVSITWKDKLYTWKEEESATFTYDTQNRLTEVNMSAYWFYYGRADDDRNKYDVKLKYDYNSSGSLSSLAYFLNNEESTVYNFNHNNNTIDVTMNGREYYYVLEINSKKQLVKINYQDDTFYIFEHDNNDNVSKMEYYQGSNYLYRDWVCNYDDKNGIISSINTDQWVFSLFQIHILTFEFAKNNIKGITYTNYKEDGSKLNTGALLPFNVVYDADDYPSQFGWDKKLYTITYKNID